MNGPTIAELARRLDPDARRLFEHARPVYDRPRYRELVLKIGDYVPTLLLDTQPAPNQHKRQLLTSLAHLPPGLQLPHLAWYLRFLDPLPLPRASGFRDRLFFTDAQAYRPRYIDLKRRQDILDQFERYGCPQLPMPAHHEHPLLEEAIRLFVDYGSALNAARYTLRLRATTPRGHVSTPRLSQALYEYKTSRTSN